jgi:putative nucleotidyltransferase with HDIG domain
VKIAVFFGLIFLALAFFIARTTKIFIPKSIRGKWVVMELFILFFLAGYLVFLFIIGHNIEFPTDLITSTIFLGGSLFVLLVINVTQTAIKGIKSREMQVSEMHRQLYRAYESTIEGWGRALEQRDTETNGHTVRVTEITIKLARKYGLSEEAIEHIRRGALLHDIGKMSISDKILLNTGSLSEAERKEMEKHSIYAYQMLSSIEYLKPALDIPYCHHERWDGSGYPRGLKGEEIPLAARIFAVADVWDALISQRRYHLAWSSKKVCDYIVSGSGTHFDPEVVEKFLALELCDENSSLALKL